MKAAWYEKNGPAREVLEIGEMPRPEPGAGEVRVRIRASGVNPSDVKARSGVTRKIAFPRVVPHSDGAGEIEAVGPGVPAARVGERVWLWNSQYQRPFGTAAEFCTLPAQQAAKLPDNISFAEGAGLGVPALTGYEAALIDGADAIRGAPVLVSGGAGAVAYYAIQFAKSAGATVITTVSSEEKASQVRAASADHVIDYKREDVGARIKQLTGGRGVERLIELDLAVNAPLIAHVMAPRGTVVIYGTGGGDATIPSSYCLNNHITFKFFLVYTLLDEERDRAVAEINARLARGTLINRVAQSFPLADIAAAHEAVESGKLLGKVVVLP